MKYVGLRRTLLRALNLSGLVASSAWRFGVVCGFATSWGVDSATGGT